jgi:hypothetical protein
MRKIIFFALVAIAMVACEPPKSQQRTRAVVLDSVDKQLSTGHHQYKLSYISYGVVDYEFSYFQYEIGDTILVLDKFRGRDIR